MFPNRFAWPPDLPMTMFCEPLTPLALLSCLTSVPTGAMPRDSALVRRTVSFGLGGCVNPPGVDCDVYGDGCGLRTTLSLLPTALPAVTLLIESTPGFTGRKPAGEVVDTDGSTYGYPGRPPRCGM